MKTLWLAACLGAALAAPAGAGGALGLDLTRNNGVVEIRCGEWMRHVMARDPLPMPIPRGCAVYVLGGRSTFEGGGMSLRADEGDAFTYNVFAEDEAPPRALSVAAFGENTAIDVRAGRARTYLTDGDAIALSRPRSGVLELRVLAGRVGLWEPGGDRALTAGQIAWSATILGRGRRPLPGQIPRLIPAPSLRDAPASVIRPPARR